MSFSGQSKVKNKSAAPVQITAEQILRVANESQQALPKSAPKQTITDVEELEDYRLRKRQQFETSVNRNLKTAAVYLKYAAWEESQKDLTRARSIFERALDMNYREIVLWIKYAEMEMRNKNINLARNVWDRAVSLLPRVSQLWFKFTFMEDMLGNYPAARAIFERWMQWKPEPQAWNSFIKFELRLNLADKARDIFERYILVHPYIKTWIKYSKFEEKLGNIENARNIFKRAIEFLGEDANDEQLFIAFAKFEEKYKEVERARIIYKYAIDHVPKNKAKELFETFTNFEKQQGDRIGIEDVVIGKKRFQYEEELKKNPKNYDIWFDYLKMEEINGEITKTREIYERSIGNLPPTKEKKHWKRYIYLWINYALFEELISKDIDRTRQVYKECIKSIPHEVFSFSKIWIMYSSFEIRQLNLDIARKIYGQAIGRHPKSKIFDSYIHLEIELGNFENVRSIYGKYLELMPDNCEAWSKFAQLETELGEIDRARAIFEIAVQQPNLDRPEVIWKDYIDFEIEQQQYKNAEKLYRRLLEKTNHVKVWLGFVKFIHSSNGGVASLTRPFYQEAHKSLQNSDKEERLILLENWKEFEQNFGDQESLDQVLKKIPQRIIKKRTNQDGITEEYFEYIFPEEQTQSTTSKLLEAAQRWKKSKQQ
ncbi:hypothetical protein DICPUDRAFT_93425 [Dictyostelium purpureum]|uniref:Crooked neck-like protein n=1 Tax=Dictyostelium purpureum TaxID=5786 RepID=F0Z7A7_DICPU|nr:uncharacterized protein DICPUDRAFT_93425 [Dictyostelium purpureum]EGC40143.1 hypothetical protein DICPUDRAFT_93425 [Dictyostelium purpureum]|eukprot:XP_003283333.1 hypothetical protein DICPUDRAFT_93425 [Dictyostelium purpureum]